jgi:hypothetical protein
MRNASAPDDRACPAEIASLRFHQIMDEVPGEAVVIVDDEDHGAAIADAGRGATALARDGSALIVLEIALTRSRTAMAVPISPGQAAIIQCGAMLHDGRYSLKGA